MIVGHEVVSSAGRIAALKVRLLAALEALSISHDTRSQLHARALFPETRRRAGTAGSPS